MPVDLSVPNSIIAAYAKGREELLQRQQFAQQKAKEAQDEAFRQQQLAEQTRQFNEGKQQAEEHFNAEQGLRKASFDFAKVQAAPMFQKLFEETGVAPPGFQVLPPIQGLPIDTGKRTLIGGPEAGGLSIEARTPEVAAAEEAARQRTLLEPKATNELNLKIAEKTAEFYSKFYEKQQEHGYKMVEDYVKPTTDALAQRFAEGQTAAAILAQNPNHPQAKDLQLKVTEGNEADAALKRLAKLKESERPASLALELKQMQGRDIAAEIIAGRQPPDMSRLYGVSAFVRDELAKNKYDLTNATKDWQATTAWIKTLNSNQQVKVRQSIANLSESIPTLESLFDQWQKVSGNSSWKVANWANLKVAEQQGGAAGAVAQALETHINDMTSNLANVFSTGNASTDKQLQLASSNLSANWSPEVMKKTIDLLKTHLNIRMNSILSSGPAGGSESNIYTPPGVSTFGVGSNPNEIHYDINGNRIK